MYSINETHAPGLESWVTSANAKDNDFPIQNLPHAVFRVNGSDESLRGGVAIGDMILDMQRVCSAGVFVGQVQETALKAAGSTLNSLMAAGHQEWHGLRNALSNALRIGSAVQPVLAGCLVPQSLVSYGVPAQIGDYTDFFTSEYHAANVGQIFAPGTPLFPNFKWLPIGYHGRSSSIEISGSSFRRPWGQRKPDDMATPTFGPTVGLDYEVELGAFVGPGNARGEPIAIEQAEQHLFGLCLLNDWSARDIQAWEAKPLGPFLAKNFLTTISPWIVTMEALAPFRAELPRSEDSPATFAHLTNEEQRMHGGLDIQLEAWIHTTRAKNSGMRLSHTSFKHAYWSLAQMVTHHTSSGCNLRSGDLLGTGTQSGSTRSERGCLLELSEGGKFPVHLPNDEVRSFLQDGDAIILRGWCSKEGYRRIGFGECRGEVLPTPVRDSATVP